MSATRFSITPESQSLSICGPLFIAEETEAPEGKGLEDGHMAGQGCSEKCRRCLTSMGEGGGGSFWTCDSLERGPSQAAQAHHVCSSSEGHGGELHPPSLPSATE